MYTVYMHTTPSGKRYVGITCQNPKSRWQNGNGYCYNDYFYKAIKKYGWDNIKHEILFENLTKEEAEQKEIALIAEYKSNQREFGYNIQNGGNCVGTHSEETKEKIRKASSMHKHSKETKEKISESRKGEKNPNYGKRFSEEHKQKISKSQKGEKGFWYGKHPSKETLKKLSNARKGDKNPIAKPVICIETKVYYATISEASANFNIHSSSITMVCKGKRKTAGGYHWQYAV